jgi:DNA-binding HxlR family transcriptional regulator
MQDPGGVSPLHDDGDDRVPAACSIAASLEIVGDRWTILILRDAFKGIRRFDELRRDLDIPRAVLADRLRRLVDHGVLVKRRYQERPPRDEYRLTPMGLQLSPILVALMQWGDRWLSGEDGPPTLLVHEPCGTEIDLGFYCWHCEQSFTPTDIISRPGPGDSADHDPADHNPADHDPRSTTGARTARTARPAAG